MPWMSQEQIDENARVLAEYDRAFAKHDRLMAKLRGLAEQHEAQAKEIDDLRKHNLALAYANGWHEGFNEGYRQARVELLGEA